MSNANISSSTSSNHSVGSSKPVTDMLWIRDSDALEKLIEWYRPLLREIAEGMLGKTLAAKVDASDIVQETLDGVSSGFKNHNLQNRREWKGYLRRALARRVADVRQHFLRTRKRDIRREQIDVQHEAIMQSVVDPRAESPLDKLISDEFAHKAIHAFKRLPKELRKVLRWRFRKEMTYEEIGNRVGRTPDAVRMLVNRCVLAIRKEIERND
jgi:RNA polymerase sigma-70 factor (ECF subfamily)